MADITFDVQGWPKAAPLQNAVDALGGWAPAGSGGSSFHMKNDVFGVKAQVDVTRHFSNSRIRVRTWGNAGEWWLEQAAGKIRQTIENATTKPSVPLIQFEPTAPPPKLSESDPLDLANLREEMLRDIRSGSVWEPDEIESPPSSGVAPVDSSAVLSIEQSLGAKPIQGKWTPLGGPGSGSHSWSESPNNWQSDNAIDLKVPEGTPVRAIADGVISTKFGYGPMETTGRFAGSRLHLETNGGDTAFYTHLSKLVATPGQRVKEGEVIAYSGSANGVPHLHFATEKSDPVAWAYKGKGN